MSQKVVSRNGLVGVAQNKQRTKMVSNLAAGRVGRLHNGSLNTQLPLMEMKRNIQINKIKLL